LLFSFSLRIDPHISVVVAPGTISMTRVTNHPSLVNGIFFADNFLRSVISRLPLIHVVLENLGGSVR
jgi:hypothetical protein